MKNEAHAFAFRLRSVALAALCASAISLAGCGGVLGAGNPDGQTSPSTTAGTCPTTMCVGDDQNGKTINLHSGDTLTVMLTLTTWSFQGSSNSQVLAQVGSAVASPGPFNKSTCPYGGCGTMTATFRAVGPGAAKVSASRTSCGEAMGCTTADPGYQLNVAVTSPSS